MRRGRNTTPRIGNQYRVQTPTGCWPAIITAVVCAFWLLSAVLDWLVEKSSALIHWVI